MLINSFNQNKWKPEGDAFGLYIDFKDLNLGYVNVPKNASSWTRGLLENIDICNRSNFHNENVSKKRMIVPLRDPVERWVSGIAEFFSSRYPDIEITKDIEKLVFSAVAFDNHTDLQLNFIHTLDEKNCIFLKCDHSYSKTFIKLMSEYNIDTSFYTTEKINVSKEKSTRLKFKLIFYQKIKDTKNREAVENYFRPDYEFMEKINFYSL